MAKQKILHRSRCRATVYHIGYTARTHSSAGKGAEKLSFKSEEFDVIICLNVIDRVTHPRRLLNSISRVLKKDGIALVATPYDWGDDYTPVKNRISNIKQYFTNKKWEILFEQQYLPFVLFFNVRRKEYYRDHLLVVRKK